MFGGVGVDEPVQTTSKVVANAMPIETAIKIQNAAGITMVGWAIISAATLYYLLRPSMK